MSLGLDVEVFTLKTIASLVFEINKNGIYIEIALTK